MKQQKLCFYLVICFIFTSLRNQEFLLVANGFSGQRLLSRKVVFLALQKNTLLDGTIPVNTVSNVSLNMIETHSVAPKKPALKRHISESEYSLNGESILNDYDSMVSSSSEYDDNEEGKKLILGLLWIIAMLSALDRVAMSVALVPMSMEFDLTDTMKGSISSLFSVGYGLAIIPAGLLVARTSPKIVLSAGVAVWSLATLATPDATDLLALTVGSTMAPLLVVRAFVGAGESLVLPAIQRFLSVWTTADQKGSAVAFILSGFQMGTIAAYLLSPVIMDSFGGWRSLFYVYGATGLVILVPWLVLARDSPILKTNQQPYNFQNNLASKLGVHDAVNVVESYKVDDGAPWGVILRSRGAWAMLLAHCARNWGLYNTLAWTPTFYAQEYNIGVRESAVLSVLPSVAGAIGGFVAGLSADYILRRMQQEMPNEAHDGARTNVRKLFQGISLFGSAASLGVLALNIPEEPWVAQTFLTASLGLLSFSAAGFDAAIQDKAGEKWAGLLYSVSTLPAVMSGTLAVWVTGRVLDLTNQDWSMVFLMTAIINVVGATAFISLYNSKREFD